MVTIEIKGQEYKLRLTTMGVLNLEEKLGRNPVDVYVQLGDGQIPKIKDIVFIIHQALQPYNSNMNLEKAAMLLDDYVSEGNSIFDLLNNQIYKLFQEAGLLAKEEEVEDNPN